MRGPVLSLLALLLFACEKQATEDWQTFTEVYTDYIKLATADTARVENREFYLENVLANHNMSKETFDRYFVTLKSNPEKLQQALKLINEELRKETNTPAPRQL